LLARAIEISTELGSDNQSADTRASGATEVGQLLEEAIAWAIRNWRELHLFRLQAQNPSFYSDRGRGIETADYNGDTNDFQLRIGKDDTIVVGRTVNRPSWIPICLRPWER